MASGGYKGASPARETSPEQYPGVWELTEQFQAQADGNWPFQADDCAPKSIRFNHSDAAHLSKAFASAGNRQSWTWSGWAKRSKLSSTRQVLFSGGVSASNTDWLEFGYEADSFYWTTNNYTSSSTAKFRDPSAWHHVVVTYNGSYLKWYSNGVEVHSVSKTGDLGINGAWNHAIGKSSVVSGRDFGGYLAQCIFIDGQVLQPTDFGFYDGQGIWQPKRFTGDYSSGPVYSNLVTGAHDTNHGWGTTYQTAHMFDGSLTTMAIGQANDTGLTFTPSSPLGANATTIRIYGMDDACPDSHLKINGINYGGLVNSGTGWTVLKGTGAVGSGISSIESIYLRDNSAGNQSYRFAALEIDGVILTDASVGRNSFKLDFSDGVKDQSGLGNDWTANNVAVSGDGPASSLAWESGDSGWTIASGGGSATEGGSNGYQDVFTGLLEVGKIYAFTTSHTNGDQNGGWFFADSNSTSLSGTHPNQGRGTNSIGQRGRSSGHNDVDKAGAHGTFATANGVTAGDTNLSGFTIINPEGSDTINWVVDRVKNKVWVKRSTDSAWIQGGNPSDGDSAPSFHLPSTGNLYFGFVQYNNTNFTISIAAYSFTASGRASDIFVDSPVNGNEASTGAGNERRGNYCNLNPLSNGGFTMSNGNLSGSSQGYAACLGTIAYPKSGKWYYEFSYESVPGYNHSGIATGSTTLTGQPGYDVNTQFTYWQNGSKTNNVGYGASFAANDVIGVAFDADAGSLVFYKNGVSQGVNATGLTTDTYFPYISAWSYVSHVNFGQRPFSHPVTGYSPLATSFLPEPTIKRGDEAMDVALWTGNGASQTIDNLPSPDLVWIKNRNSTDPHIITDIVRGAGKLLQAQNTTAETDNSDTATAFSAFTSDGFTVGYNANWSTNTNGSPYVSWNWDAGESTTTIAAGGLNSSVYNQSHAITSNITDNLPATGNPLSNWFNGQRANKLEPSGSGSLDFSSVSALQNFSGTLQFAVSAYSGSTSMKFVINASTDNLTFTTEALPSSSGGFPSQLLTIPVTSLSTLDFTSIGGQSTQFWGMYLDGKLLVDSTATPDTLPSIATTVRARPETGFSIVTATTVTSGSSFSVGHGLGAAPAFAIFKDIDNANNWGIYHQSVTTTSGGVLLFTSAAAQNYTWFPSAPTSTTFTLSVGGWGTGGDVVGYLWSPVEGYSSFGSYVGNGSSDGPFVYTGHRSRWVAIKKASAAGNWGIYDTARDPANVRELTLAADSSVAESTDANKIDITSNGFKVRASNANVNSSGGTYIYAAFAEHPFASNNRAV